MSEIQKLLYSVKEAAFCVSLSPRTLYNDVSLVRQGKKPNYLIKPHYQGKRLMFHIDDLKAYADSLPTEIQVIRKKKPRGEVKEV